MSKRQDQFIANLARKNAAKIVQPKGERAAQYDDTLRQRPAEEDTDTKRLFKEMKKREF